MNQALYEFEDIQFVKLTFQRPPAGQFNLLCNYTLQYQRPADETSPKRAVFFHFIAKPEGDDSVSMIEADARVTFSLNTTPDSETDSQIQERCEKDASVIFAQRINGILKNMDLEQLSFPFEDHENQ